MRKLTIREKIGIAVVIIGAIVVLYFLGILNPSRLSLTGGDLEVKKAELKDTEELIKLDKLVSGIEDDTMAEVGLQGNLIPESLFQKISNELTVEKLNQVKTPRELYEIDPALKRRASSILAYRRKIGKFENIEQLKEIKCSIFEIDPAQAVISKRISELAQKAGINPKYQLSIKPQPGKKRERITIKDRQKLIEKLYRHELKEELNSMTKQLESSKTEEGSIDTTDISQNSEKDVSNVQKKQNRTQLTDDIPQVKEKKINRKFPPLPERIPIETRIEIAKAILSSDYSLNKQINSNTRLKAVLDEFQSSKRQTRENPLNVKPFLLNYVKQVDKSQQEVFDWLKGAPTSYTRQAYLVEMLSVKGKLSQLVKLVYSIESSSGFLKIRDLQITIANKKDTMLNANFKIIATVL